MGSSITRSTGTRPSGAAPQRPVSAAYTQAAITKSLAADASSRAVARMSRAGSQVHRAAAITELGALNTQELAAEERLAGLWGRPVGSPCNALERAIGARFNSDGEVDKFVKGMIRIQRLAAPYRKKVKNIHYRRNVAREILKTEEFYVESLDVLLCTFLEPLMKLAALKKEQLPQITNLVSNLVIIRNFNKTLLQDMRPRLEAWSESQCIGDIFVSTSMYLKSYTVYVSIYNGATTELVDCCKRNVEIDSFLTAQSEQASRQSIYAYLIQPVQRIPRYRMLLADLLKHTGPTHKDHANLEKATNLVGDVASIVNSKAAEAERIAKVIEIQNRLIGCAVGLVSPSRRFVESSLVLVWNNNMKPDQAERRVIFLFNDLIVEAKPSKKGGEEDKVKFIQDYHLTRLHPSRSDHHYGIFLLMEGGEPLLKLFFKEKVERDKIKEELKKVLDELKVNRQKYEELVDKRARERAEKTKEMFDARYNLNSSSSETEPTPAAEGGKDNKWEARLKAMKERQAALRQQPEETPQTKSRSLSTGLPPAKEALGVPQQPAGPAGGRSATVASARYSLPPTLMPPQPSPVSEKLSSSGGGVATKSPQKKKGNISRLSAFFGGSSAKKMNKDKDATA
ncbi:RhoGEF domain containing protein [Acanthamoeba castellanii str. Neff]|uniref:RhoGEF domain containing protein n=1 Tax=Acanthamoeba castellanii (strain ATCC 30010 / Neff) TaxID=1257118 RepID=L8HIV0_ACACF|nr:RhoGEF domain containing protein [Acanthamoeba castellanii str. Neff]ELR25120.1 RhoGEF domain containing protein [Acanthamoeba castellanii str. Neff]